MTKRNGNFDGNASKKSKVEDNIDALWGEDLDGDGVDDCLLLATQFCEQNEAELVQHNNISIIPNYSMFKQNGDNVFTSTQHNNNVNVHSNNSKPTVSKFTIPTTNAQKVPANVQELQEKIQKLENNYTMKEGEVSILRSQLKQIRVTLETDHQKKEKEWAEKIQLTKKKLTFTKSELDFKTLEVANLKNKITELTKSHMDATLNSTKSIDNQRAVEATLKFNGMLEEQYPLLDKIDASFFTLSKPEHFYVNCKESLSKFSMDIDNKLIEQYKADSEYNSFKLDSIFPYISALTNSSESALNSNKSKDAIDKILFAALEVTKSFHKNLTLLEDNVEEQSIRQRDLMYLDKKYDESCINSSLFGAEECFKNEIGIKCRRIIVVLAEILPYSEYLRHLILQKSINLNDTLGNFFNLVLSVIKIIGVLRIAERCVGFLCSVVIFMTKTTATADFCNWYISVGDIIKEIVFTRPPRKTLEYLSEFLRHSSSYVDFVNNLCQMPRHRSYSGSTDILFYNEESCLLRVFTVLYKENFINSENNNKVSMAILQFIKHILISNVLWTHYNESNQCKCFRKIAKLGIKIIHQTARLFVHEKDKDVCINILKFSIDLLHIIKFKHMDIFNKSSVISEYKLIVKILLKSSYTLKLNEQQRETLKELNLREEMQEINDADLAKIPI